VLRTAVDLGTSTHFTVVVDPENPFFGQFGFARVGAGVFWASGATVTPNSDGSIQVVYAGPGWSDPDADVDIYLGLHDSSEQKIQVDLDLEMTLAAKDGAGAGRLIADGVTYEMATSAQAPSPDPTVQSVLELMRASDWRGLYGFFVPEFQTRVSQDDYISEMRKGIARTGAIVNVKTTGAVSIYDMVAWQAADVPLEITLDKNGTISTYASRLELVYGEGRWLIFSIDEIVKPGETSP
jgi:hypothetical protein